jgi:DNA polymerase elongation subunit (family B)
LDYDLLGKETDSLFFCSYSTCIGKIGTLKKFGVTELELQDGLLDTIKDHLNGKFKNKGMKRICSSLFFFLNALVSPNGVAFVKPDIRKGLLAKMLSELLETRVMVKTSMKDYKDDSVSAEFILHNSCKKI